MDKKTKVYLAIPCYDWRPMAEVMINCMQQELPDNIELEFSRSQIIDWLPVQLARNQALFNFLRKSDADYLWFCDADNRPDITTLKHLVEDNVDAVSAIVPLRFWPLRYCVVKDGKPITSFEWLWWPLIEVDNIWTWCCLLSRRLCEDVRKFTEGHPYQFRVSDYVLRIWGKPEEYEWQDKQKWRRDNYQVKDGKIHKVKRMIGEDLWFWEQAQKLGYQFYADLRCLCKHATGKSEPRRVSNDDFIISESFIIKQKYGAEYNSANPEAGDIPWGSDDAIGEVEVEILWADSDWGQAS